MKKICFYSNAPLNQLQSEQYSVQDIRILSGITEDFAIANSWSSTSWGSDIYFSWWASGSIVPLMKAKLMGKPIVVVAGGNEATIYLDSVTKRPYGYSSMPWWKKLATKIVMVFADRVIVVSEYLKRESIKIGCKRPVLIYNSVNTDLFKPKVRERRFITTIFSISHEVRSIKRIDNFITAILELNKIEKNLEVLIIGKKGDYYRELVNRLEAEGIRDKFNFVGLVNNEEVAGLLNQSRVYVQISDNETFGLSVAEAMSCGVPVVVSNVGGIPEVVGDLGVFVDHNDPISVCKGISSVLNLSLEHYSELGRMSRSRIVELFSFENRRDAIEELIKEVLVK